MTNASVFNSIMADNLKNFTQSAISVSLDAGTRETFVKVKGVDLFEKVCTNIREYSKCGAVTLKYIFIPQTNDNDKDISQFISYATQLNTCSVEISTDLYTYNAKNKDLPLETMAKIKEMMLLCHKANIAYGLANNCFSKSDFKVLFEYYWALTYGD